MNCKSYFVVSPKYGVRRRNAVRKLTLAFVTRTLMSLRSLIRFSPRSRYSRLVRPANALTSLVFLGVGMHACMLGARRQIRSKLFTTFWGDLFKILFDADSVPHGDTMKGASSNTSAG